MRIKWMSSNVEAQEVPFVPQLFDGRPWREMDCLTIRLRSSRHLQLAEERDLTTPPVFVGGGASRQSLINSLKKFRSIAFGKIKCPGPYQIFQNLAIDQLAPQKSAIIVKRFE